MARRAVAQARLSAGTRIGVAVGYATLGRIGFAGCYDYGAVGSVMIVASRLSDAAPATEILISKRLQAEIEDEFDTEPVPDLELKSSRSSSRVGRPQNQ